MPLWFLTGIIIDQYLSYNYETDPEKRLLKIHGEL